MNERLRTDSQETKIPSSEETQEVSALVADNATYADIDADFDVSDDATTEEKPKNTLPDWNDEMLDFFANEAYSEPRIYSEGVRTWEVSTMEVPTTAKLLEQLDTGKLSADDVRSRYSGALVQYDALRPIINRALASHNVMLPSRETFAMATPLVRRSFEQAISQRLTEHPSQFSVAINRLLTRLTILTEICTTYEEVAEELGISLTQGDVDSVEKAA